MGKKTAYVTGFTRNIVTHNCGCSCGWSTGLNGTEKLAKLKLRLHKKKCQHIKQKSKIIEFPNCIANYTKGKMVQEKLNPIYL